MATPDRVREFVDAISTKFVEDGKLIEARWMSMRAIAIPKETSKEQLEQMRLAFFCGAQHLFASIFSILEKGEDATENDLRRMRLIADELQAFVDTMKIKFRGGLNS